jgi:hypothetical protein
MKEIGGYFELELAKKQAHHSEAIQLNSGRNCFQYILRAQGTQKVYVPNYICDSIIEPLESLNVSYEFYNVDKTFEIAQELNLNRNEKLFYVNYFALKSDYIQDLAERYGDNLIVDNTQAFFEMPVIDVDTIYSPRKFFGVGDGGYLYTNKYLEEDLDVDISHSNTSQLLGRIDISAAIFFGNYQEAEDSLTSRPIRKMSTLTSSILASIDYDNSMLLRQRNFFYLHSELKHINRIENALPVSAPFVYPLLTDNEGLRDRLISNKIYVAKYWNEVLDRTQVSDVEKDLVNKMIPLPIDQRYTIADMKRIVGVIKA